MSLGGTSAFGFLHLPEGTMSVAVRYLLYFGGVLAIGRWWKPAARDRKDRVSLFPAIAAAFWAGVLVFLWPWQGGEPWAGGIVPVVLAAVAVQLVSPWTPPPPPIPKKLRFRPGDGVNTRPPPPAHD